MKLYASKTEEKNIISFSKAKGSSVTKIKTHTKESPKGFTSLASSCHKWHKHLFPYFHFVSFKFPFSVLEMNIWSFPPWTCHRWAFEAARQRIVFVTLRDIQQREIKPQRGGGRTWNGKHCVLALFTCLEALFVSNVLTTNVSGQQCRTIFTFLEMIACFNVFSFFPPHSDSLSCECCCGLHKEENFPFNISALLFWSCWVFLCCYHSCDCDARACACVWTAALEVCTVAIFGIPPPRIKWEKDIWALTTFQLIPHLRWQEDKKW